MRDLFSEPTHPAWRGDSDCIGFCILVPTQAWKVCYNIGFKKKLKFQKSELILTANERKSWKHASNDVVRGKIEVTIFTDNAAIPYYSSKIQVPIRKVNKLLHKEKTLRTLEKTHTHFVLIQFCFPPSKIILFRTDHQNSTSESSSSWLSKFEELFSYEQSHPVSIVDVFHQIPLAVLFWEFKLEKRLCLQPAR